MELFPFGKAGERKVIPRFDICLGFIWCWPGLCEIGWPLGFKLSQTPGTGPGKFAAYIACSVFSMVLSGFLLWLAQRNIPIGTAYAVWTGIGALGTFLVGILWFGDSSNIWRMLAASFLLIGIIGLKLAPGH